MQKTIEKDADGKVRQCPPSFFFPVVVLGRQRGSYQEPEGMEMAKKGCGERERADWEWICSRVLVLFS